MIIINKKKINEFLDECVEIVYGYNKWLEFNIEIKENVKRWYKSDEIDDRKEIPLAIYDIVLLSGKRIKDNIKKRQIEQYIKFRRRIEMKREGRVL